MCFIAAVIAAFIAAGVVPHRITAAEISHGYINYTASIGTQIMDVAINPCSTCPYRKDTPPGVWHKTEYEKLPAYDEGTPDPAFGVFLCHQTNATGRETACRGWLTVAADSIAVRLAILNGDLTCEQRDAKVRIPLYDSGKEACAAGLAGIKKPSRAAREAMGKLLRRGAGSFSGKPRKRKKK